MDPKFETQRKAETCTMPLQLRAAELVPDSYSGTDGTVDVVWTTGVRRRAYDWRRDRPYEEELVVDASAVDMSRFDAGSVPVLDGHNAWGGVKAILGVVTRAWLDKGQGFATIRLSTRPEIAGIVADIQAGVIRSISVGYSVQTYEITAGVDRKDGGELDLYRAVRWQPMEISFVPVPADPQAGTRSESQRGDGVPCTFVYRAPAAHRSEVENMDKETLQGDNAPDQGVEVRTQVTAPAQPVATVQSAQPEPQERSAQPAQPVVSAADAATIVDLCQRHGTPALAGDLIRRGSTVDAARAAILDRLAQQTGGGQRNVAVQTVRDETEVFLRGIQESIEHRIGVTRDLTENGKRFRGLSLIEVGREYLETRGVSTRGMSRMDLAGTVLTYRGLGMGTTDFSYVLANVANKRLRTAYEQSPSTYQVWARRAPNAPDFKDISVTQISAAPELLQVNEHGEFKYGTMSDGGISYKVVTHGRIVAFTRQALINDDLRGFDRLVGAFGASAARLENRLVYAQITGNPVMPDNVDLFHASHGNYGTTGTTLSSLTVLAAARAAMRKQTGLQGEKLNITPRFLIVPAALEQAAYQFTSSNFTADSASAVNEFRQGGRTALEPVVEAILADDAAWYMAADPNVCDTVEYCYLDGAEGPVVETKQGWDVDGLEFKCRLDFAAKVLDHRGLYKATGAGA